MHCCFWNIMYISERIYISLKWKLPWLWFSRFTTIFLLHTIIKVEFGSTMYGVAVKSWTFLYSMTRENTIDYFHTLYMNPCYSSIPCHHVRFSHFDYGGKYTNTNYFLKLIFILNNILCKECWRQKILQVYTKYRINSNFLIYTCRFSLLL